MQAKRPDNLSMLITFFMNKKMWITFQTAVDNFLARFDKLSHEKFGNVDFFSYL